jgi:hypothetical protein
MEPDDILRQQLLQLLRGGNAHLTFEQAVADFPPEDINKKPPNVSYSAWQLLEHIRIAQSDILQFVLNPNHKSPKWPEGYWPEKGITADEDDWDKTIRNIHKDLDILQELVANPDTDLTAPIPHARDYTILREVLLVSDHNAYHIGEFAILREVMDNWKK